MTDQITMPWGVVEEPVSSRDPLDRDYTPYPVALAIVRHLRDAGLVPWSEEAAVIEPSVGEGAFVWALRRLGFPGYIAAVDADPDAPYPRGADIFIKGSAAGDFLGPTWAAAEPYFDAALGNTPYSRPTGRLNSKGEPIVEEIASAHILRAMALVKPGGVGCFVQTSGWWAAGQCPRRQELRDVYGEVDVLALRPRPSFRGDPLTGAGPTDGRNYVALCWRKGATPRDEGAFKTLNWRDEVLAVLED